MRISDWSSDALPISGAWDLNRVTRTLSDFADTALDEAIATAFAERVPDAEPRGFAVIALGKHGSRELNYSSDIAPILLFDPETLTRRARDDPIDAPQPNGRRVVQMLYTRPRAR